jgi:phosphatidylserine/phosphatidylglycerophosphate/cardiolipin synthase-like enzyme
MSPARTLFAAFCAALAVAAAPSAAAGHGIEYRTLFQDPGATPAPDLSLEQHAIALTEATPAGARITFAFRDFNRQPVADALIAAAARGVRVEGVVDGGERARTAVTSLRAALGPDFVICGEPGFTFQSCITNSAVPSLQHNKFMTFSALAGGRRHVVLQTSKNFFGPSQFHYYNDMVEISGDRRLYEGYVRYLEAMKAQRRSADHYVVTSGDGGRNTMFPSPRSQPDRDTDDTIVDRMDEIDCSRGGEIRAANMAFRSARAVIMRKLAELRRDGCDIEVILSNADGDILAGLASAGIRVHPFFLRAADPRPQVIVHSKFWLVDARSAVTGRRTRLTYAGSSNWRDDQQLSDDMLLRIADHGVYRDYRGYWELIRSRAASDQNRPANEAVAPAAAHAVLDRRGRKRGPVRFRIAASDGHNVGASGLRRLHVELSGAETGAWDFEGETAGLNVQELSVSARGETTVTYFAEDAKGNLSAPRSFTVKVSRRPPSWLARTR